ncbi:hypothetical protein N1027_17710 [Herbiconiux sp. CPCC 205763]|uniref:Uncharacterized protein n=1 Tax=Herbiconiux aconitum TaxID=2970913 RepID=A0ABT2GYD7_9MICO|nr:hypothetical protein [Herbiconiux aconitum]MCS5719971.1 hypothetical protein [Herbiconiux aconitum]
MDACTRLCSVADEIAGRAIASRATPRRFLVEFGHAAGGVRTGPLWLLDAARGGRNRIVGQGFAPEFDDSTRGQARHFAGIVAVATRIGPTPARWASVHLGRDRPDSADGRLTDAAIEFTRLVASGRLALGEASTWIAHRLCAAPPAG